MKGQVQVGKAVRESHSNDSLDDCFAVVRSGRNASAPSVESATVPLQNRFAVLQKEYVSIFMFPPLCLCHPFSFLSHCWLACLKTPV